MADLASIELHLAVCRRFSAAVAAAGEKWDRPSPCESWDARDVVEHVIGFHDVLLLRPLGCKPERPRDDPERRWALTVEALDPALRREDFFQHVADGQRLLPKLTRDVLVHTWDLARAVGADDRLDSDWCAMIFERLPADLDALTRSRMFAAPVAIEDGAGIQSQLLARLGRDPSWGTTRGSGAG